MISIKKIIVILLFSAAVYSCKKDEIPGYQNAADYYPVHTGMVWIYHLDSTTIPPFGASLITHSYLIKDSAGSPFQDNTGRTSWPIYRFITDTLAQNPWESLSTSYVTPTNNTIEVVDDNNLRFIKLVSPISNNVNWKGNSYIDTRSGTTPYQYLDDWDYLYDSINIPYKTLDGFFDSVVVVHQRDDTSPPGDFNPEIYQQRNYSEEVYAHGVGLIYKNFLHWTWQPTPPPANYDDDSYGIILNLISYKN